MLNSCNVIDGAAFSETDAVALNQLNSRLAIIRDRVRGVASGHHTGFYLFGPAGTSKTYTVRSTLKRIGAKFHYYRGHLTPMGLFDLLAKFGSSD